MAKIKLNRFQPLRWLRCFFSSLDSRWTFCCWLSKYPVSLVVTSEKEQPKLDYKINSHFENQFSRVHFAGEVRSLITMKLFIVVIFAIGCASARKLEEKFSWKELDFAWPSEEAKQEALRSGKYIVNHNLPLGLDVWNDKLFITVPRWLLDNSRRWYCRCHGWARFESDWLVTLIAIRFLWPIIINK